MPRRTHPPRRAARAARAGRTDGTPHGVDRALDEVRFGPDRTLNLRTGLPTAADAVYRTEAWLRERQVAQGRESNEVLVITGRGLGSIDGIPVIREAVLRLLATLRRVGVVADVREHTAGALVVSLASVRALVEAPRRRHHALPRPDRDPVALAALDAETRMLLRQLAHAALAALGLRTPAPAVVDEEMVRQFSHLVAAIPSGPDRAAALRAAIATAIEDYSHA